MTEKNERTGLQLVGAGAPLIAPDEGPPVELVNPDGSGEIVLICEHASNLVPRSLQALGLDDQALFSHVAWDPGAAPVARQMVAMLDAPLILQRFSRLVYDCNRPPHAESAMPEKSEVFDIPGNVGLTAEEREARTDALYRPFREAVASVIDGMTGAWPITGGGHDPLLHPGLSRQAAIGRARPPARCRHAPGRRHARAFHDLTGSRGPTKRALWPRGWCHPYASGRCDHPRSSECHDRSSKRSHRNRRAASGDGGAARRPGEGGAGQAAADRGTAPSRCGRLNHAAGFQPRAGRTSRAATTILQAILA